MDSVDIWDLARAKQAVHGFSTLMTAQDGHDRLATERDIDRALLSCRQNGVTKAYVDVHPACGRWP